MRLTKGTGQPSSGKQGSPKACESPDVDDPRRLVGFRVRDKVGQQQADGYPLRAQALSQVHRFRRRNDGVVPAMQQEDRRRRSG